MFLLTNSCKDQYWFQHINIQNMHSTKHWFRFRYELLLTKVNYFRSMKIVYT